MKKKVAVIGSGISGLSASLFLSKNFDVNLFEKNNYLGGHTRTIKIKENELIQNIDTGFIVFNENNYPDLSSFFDYLNISTLDSKMSFSISFNSFDFEYSGNNVRGLFAQKKNIFSFNFLMLVFDIIKLYNKCKNIKSKNYFTNHTIENFFDEFNISKKIRDLHIYPMISSIWSSNKTDVRNLPFIFFLEFFNNHGLFNLFNRPKWKFVKNGSNQYIEKLLQKKLFKYELNKKIIKIIRKKENVDIIFHNNKKLTFDKIIIATHADDALKLISEPTAEEIDILSNFKYTKNEAFLHSDVNLMPRRKLAWSSWNFIENMKQKDLFSLTYWMNNLQNIKSKKNYFVTINPHKLPDKVLDSTFFTHPIFNIETFKAQKKLSLIQGKKNTFYCGSYCGYGFHEDGIQSAALISNLLKTDLPWKRKEKFYNRLNYNI